MSIATFGSSLPVSLELTTASRVAVFDGARLPSGWDVERTIRYQSLLTRELFRAIDRLMALQGERRSRGVSDGGG